MIYLIKVSQFCISILISGAAAPKPPLNYAQSLLGSHLTRSGDQNGGPRDCLHVAKSDDHVMIKIKMADAYR